MHELLHWLGLDNAASTQYLFFSGVGFSIFAPAVYLRHHNCHHHFCWRVGHYQAGMYNVCKRHHPDIPRKVRMEHIQFAHDKANKP